MGFRGYWNFTSNGAEPSILLSQIYREGFMVAYIPDGKVVGLSKIPRVVEVFARRLQIQEQLTEQIADAISKSINPKGVAVVVHARHMCMEMRGIEKINSTTVSSALRGLFKSDLRTRNEFFSIINTPAPLNF